MSSIDVNQSLDDIIKQSDKTRKKGRPTRTGNPQRQGNIRKKPQNKISTKSPLQKKFTSKGQKPRARQQREAPKSTEKFSNKKPFKADRSDRREKLNKFRTKKTENIAPLKVSISNTPQSQNRKPKTLNERFS